jgi:DNA-binding response OmpR family regulator
VPRALIVDDEAEIRFALKRWFERQQYQVDEAEDGEVALRLLRESPDSDDQRYVVVVCDLHLPHLSGEAIVGLLNAERPALAQRIILTTGDAVSDAPAGTVMAEHPYVLQKPFDLATLRDMVAKVRGI